MLPNVDVTHTSIHNLITYIFVSRQFLICYLFEFTDMFLFAVDIILLLQDQIVQSNFKPVARKVIFDCLEIQNLKSSTF